MDYNGTKLARGFFSDPNLKVTKFDCNGGLSVEQAPTFDDIRNKLLNKLVIDHTQTELPCVKI